jgi:hypothetical protein
MAGFFLVVGRKSINCFEISGLAREGGKLFHGYTGKLNFKLTGRHMGIPSSRFFHASALN